MLKEVWRVVQVVGAWPGVAITPGGDGLCIAVGHVVVGYLRWNGRIDLRFAPDVRDRLMSEELAGCVPGARDTGHVACDVRSLADVNRALWLLLLAYLSVDSKGTAIPV